MFGRLAGASRKMATQTSAGPVQVSIEKKLTEGFNPFALKVKNDSAKHKGHAGNPSGADDAETHFTVEIVSEAFAGVKLIQRHRMVNDALKQEFAQGLHALSIKAKAPEEQ